MDHARPPAPHRGAAAGPETRRWLIVAALFAVIGLLHLVAKPIVVADGEVGLRNPFGMTLKRYPIRSLAELEVRDGKLWHAPPGAPPRKITALSFALSAGDRARLTDAIASARAADAFA